MSFASQFSNRIWDKLYTVKVPDQVTLNPDYIRKFGTHVTGDRRYDAHLSNLFTTVMISVIKILEYYNDGIEIHIPSRDDMITIHKDIELYLGEWREHIKYDLNLDVNENKDLLLALDKLSKELYEKCKPKELFDSILISKKIGIINPYQRLMEEKKEIQKPNYESISMLVKGKNKPTTRFG